MVAPPEDTRRELRALVVAVALLVAAVVPLPDRERSALGEYGPDKLLHVLGHAAFARALAVAVGGERPGVCALVAGGAVSSCFGLCTELLQTVVPGRRFERGDVLAGLVGSAIGVVSVYTPW